VLYTHLRSAGGPEVLDEAVLFVIRVLDGKAKIVAHFADY
jgi:hypothetical protein